MSNRKRTVWSNVPAGKSLYDRLTRDGVTKFWRPGAFGIGGSWQTAASLNAERQRAGRQPIDFSKKGVPKAKPAKPGVGNIPPQEGTGRGAPGSRIQLDPGRFDREKERLKDVGDPQNKPKPQDDPKPAPAPPAAPAKPAPVPFGKTMPAPSAANLDKYKINKDWAAANPRLAQAQVARSSGQSRADINKILYKPGTAAYGASGKSEMEKQVDQMRQDREKIAKQREADKIGPQAQSSLPGGNYSPAATAKMTTRTKNILGVKEEYDAYDLVLEYLLSNGHADTLDEAHYVMMQMDSEHIQNIVEGVGGYDDPVLGPHTPGGRLVRRGVEVVKGALGQSEQPPSAKQKPLRPLTSQEKESYKTIK